MFFHAVMIDNYEDENMPCQLMSSNTVGFRGCMPLGACPPNPKRLGELVGICLTFVVVGGLQLFTADHQDEIIKKTLFLRVFFVIHDVLRFFGAQYHVVSMVLSFNSIK